MNAVVTEEDLKRETGNIRLLLEEVEKENYSYFYDEEFKEENTELKTILDESIKEFKDAVEIIENYFTEKNLSNVKDGRDRAIKADKKLTYVQTSLERKKNQSNQLKSLINSSQKQNAVSNLAYNIYLQSYVQPVFTSRNQAVSYSSVSTRQTVHKLSSLNIFDKIPSCQLENIALKVKEKKFPENSTIFKEDDYSKDVYIINSGKVSIRKSILGKEEEITVLGKGAILGEMSIIEDQRRSATAAVILGDAEIYVIQGKDFLELLEKFPKISINLNKIYSYRLRETSKKLLKYLYSTDIKKPEQSIASSQKKEIVSSLPLQFFQKPIISSKLPSQLTDNNLEKSEELSMSVLKYINISVKGRKLLQNKETIYNRIEETKDFLNSPGREKLKEKLNEALNDYINTVINEIKTLKDESLPSGIDDNFIKAKNTLINSLSSFKEGFETLLKAVTYKDKINIEEAKKHINKAFEDMDLYIKLKDEIKSKLN